MLTETKGNESMMSDSDYLRLLDEPGAYIVSLNEKDFIVKRPGKADTPLVSMYWRDFHRDGLIEEKRDEQNRRTWCITETGRNQTKYGQPLKP